MIGMTMFSTSTPKLWVELGMKTNGNGRETSSTVSVTIFFHWERERDSRKWKRERVIRVYENDKYERKLNENGR
jgi:hypothetical protein